MINRHKPGCALDSDPAFYTADMQCTCRPAPLAASHPDHPLLSREQLLEHVRQLTQAIERCGASPELTEAVILASDLGFHLERFANCQLSIPPMNEDLVQILGRPNFSCQGLAKYLRATGQTIPMRSEHEQAAVIHWLLSIYLKYGSAWSAMADAEVVNFALEQRGPLV